MSKPQNSLSTLFIDFLPAELRENSTWEIVYYVKNPFTDKLERKRNRVRPIKSKIERRKLAKQMIRNLNKRLEAGWNPFYDRKGLKELTPLNKASSIFIRQIAREVDDENLRQDTLKTYKSQAKLLNAYIADQLGVELFYCYKFDEEFIGEYLDYVRYDKGLSARTRDNYLGFLGTLSTFLISKKYINRNPTEPFSKINKKPKTRIIIPKHVRLLVFDYFREHNLNFLILCMVCYYCLVRRTEMTKLQVSDVMLEKNTLWVDAEDSKNRKSKHVTIPDVLIAPLTLHISNANPEHYLFSTNGFLPGSTRLHPDRITKTWNRMRDRLGIRRKYQWYSLKDSGITDLLVAGVPLIAVRDQARHYSSIQTDSYTPRNMLKANASIRNASI